MRLSREGSRRRYARRGQETRRLCREAQEVLRDVQFAYISVAAGPPLCIVILLIPTYCVMCGECEFSGDLLQWVLGFAQSELQTEEGAFGRLMLRRRL